MKIEVTGQIVGFASADMETGYRAILARAVMADEVGGGEVVLKWFLNTPSAVREIADFFNTFATEMEAHGDDELKGMLEGDGGSSS